jgi:hypothetical protein
MNERERERPWQHEDEVPHHLPTEEIVFHPWLLNFLSMIPPTTSTESKLINKSLLASGAGGGWFLKHIKLQNLTK